MLYLDNCLWKHWEEKKDTYSRHKTVLDYTDKKDVDNAIEVVRGGCKIVFIPES